MTIESRVAAIRVNSGHFLRMKRSFPPLSVSMVGAATSPSCSAALNYLAALVPHQKTEIMPDGSRRAEARSANTGTGRPQIKKHWGQRTRSTDPASREVANEPSLRVFQRVARQLPASSAHAGEKPGIAREAPARDMKGRAARGSPPMAPVTAPRSEPARAGRPGQKSPASWQGEIDPQPTLRALIGRGDIRCAGPKPV